MKKILSLLLIIFISSFSAIAQEKIHSFVQQKASPKEGLQAFMKNFITEFNVPNLPNEVKELKVRLKFIVEKDGSFSNIVVTDDKLNVGAEAIRVLKQMPSWNAAMHDGSNVRSSFILPITIKINNPEADANQPVYLTEDAIKTFKDSLNSFLIDTDYFDLKCNCALVRSSKNDDLQSEEFIMQSQDNKATYNVALRKLNKEQAEKELETVKSEALKQNAKVNTVKFNGVSATEIIVNMPNGDYVDNYRMLFLYKKQYVVAVSVVSYKKQIADLLFGHLKHNFKLKF